jgi:hypothetical protein
MVVSSEGLAPILSEGDAPTRSVDAPLPEVSGISLRAMTTATEMKVFAEGNA